MKRYVYLDGQTFELANRLDASVQSGEASSLPVSLDFLRRCMQDPMNAGTLRALLGDDLFFSDIPRVSHEEILRQLAWRFESRRLVLVPARLERRIPGTIGVPMTEEESAPPEEAEPYEPSEEPAPLQWIEFKVLDDDTDEPVSGVKLTVKLPDESRQTFTTDASGKVYIPNLVPGTCIIEEMVDEDALEVLRVE